MPLALALRVIEFSCCMAALRGAHCWVAQATILQERYYESEGRYLEQTQQSVLNLLVCFYEHIQASHLHASQV